MKAGGKMPRRNLISSARSPLSRIDLDASIRAWRPLLIILALIILNEETIGMQSRIFKVLMRLTQRYTENQAHPSQKIWTRLPLYSPRRGAPARPKNWRRGLKESG